MLRRLVLASLCSLGMLACATSHGPGLRVIGVDQKAPRREIVFVEVTNPAKRPMRLTRLEYAFASQGTTVSTGELSLAREVPAGAAVVVEVPLDVTTPGQLTLRGKLVATVDEIVRSFSVSAHIPD